MKPGPAPSLPDIPGATYRQIDNWIVKGYLRLERRGTGNARKWTDEEIRVARLMARLTAAGLSPALAHDIARKVRSLPDSAEIGPGITVVVIPAGGDA